MLVWEWIDSFRKLRLEAGRRGTLLVGGHGSPFDIRAGRPAQRRRVAGST